MSITSVRLNEDVEKPLDELARKLDRSKSYLINQAVREFVARQAAENARWEETLGALDSVKQGDVIEEAAVNAWLDSWGTRKVKGAPKK